MEAESVLETDELVRLYWLLLFHNALQWAVNLMGKFRTFENTRMGKVGGTDLRRDLWEWEMSELANLPAPLEKVTLCSENDSIFWKTDRKFFIFHFLIAYIINFCYFSVQQTYWS